MERVSTAAPVPVLPLEFSVNHYQIDMRTVFVSHASADSSFIESNILPPLRDNGINPWYSREDIESMTQWDKMIRVGLESCDWFMVVISPNSCVSEWVKSETHWAFKNRPNKIVPVLIADCDPSDLHLHLARRQYVDFRYDAVRGHSQLLKCWGIDESDPMVSISDAEYFSGLKGPTPVIRHDALQRRAAQLSGEIQLIGASSMILKESPVEMGYLFTSMLLGNIYYLYRVAPQYHELVKMQTETFPPPNTGDKVIKFWSTFVDGVIESMILVIKVIFPLQHLTISFDHFECEQYNELGNYLIRRNYFLSNFGRVELGTRKQPDGNTFGYVFFHETSKVVHFTIDNHTEALCVVSTGDIRPF